MDLTASNKGLEQTRSALVTAAAALAAQPWCSAGSEAAGDTTVWRKASAVVTTPGRPAARALLGLVSLGSAVQRRWLAFADHVTRRSVPRHRGGAVLLAAPAISWRYPGTSLWPATRGRAPMVGVPARSVELWLQNKGLHLTKSAPRFTAEGAAFAGEPQCSPD